MARQQAPICCLALLIYRRLPEGARLRFPLVRNGNLTHTIMRTDKLTRVLDAMQYFDAVRVTRRIGYR